jgi:hypothetical protein
MGFARFKNDEENVIEIQGFEERDSRVEQLEPRDLVLQARVYSCFFHTIFCEKNTFLY